MIEFPCGCKFEINDKGLPIFNPDITALPLDCSRTWDMIGEGNTKGVFQLESHLGRSKAKQIKPKNIKELADVLSVIRPGCLEAILDGKSLTQHYIDRKSGKDDVVYFHPALEPILKDTYGILCIHEDTYVSMSDGTEEKIKYLSANDLTNSICQQSLSNKLDVCVDVKKSPKTKGIKLTLENGYSIILTPDHKVITSRGDIEVQHLRDDDVVQTIVKQNNWCGSSCIDQGIFNDITPNKIHLCYLLGQLFGGGCSGQAIASGTLYNHNKLLPWIKSNFHTLNIRPYFNVRSNYIALHGKDRRRQHSGHTLYRYMIKCLGLDKTKKDKIIHPQIMSLAPETRRAFLAGLFDADGHSNIATNGITSICHYSSGNITVINQIRKLLSLDGIETYIDSNNTHIYINNTIKFKELINPYLIIKSINGKTNNAIHYGSFPKQQIKERLYSLNYTNIKTFAKNHDIGESVLIGSGLVNLKTAQKAGFEFNDIAFMKIKTIQPITTSLKFYSISIKNNHNLIGNGIVIKNCYQEQVLSIAKELAGYNLQEADLLRRAIGKKKVELMAQVKEDFTKKAIEVNILKKHEAEEIFNWIEKSQRYSFNLSHAVAYAFNAYQTAYTKAHFPRAFFTSYIRHAVGKQKTFDEVNELVNNARLMDIDVQPPSIVHMKKVCKLIDNKPTLGLTEIKNVGGSVFDQLAGRIKNKKYSIDKMNWDQFLMRLGKFIKSNSFESMIKAGAFDYYNLPRNKMLYDLGIYHDIKDKDKPFLENCEYDQLNKALKALSFHIKTNEKMTVHTERRLELIDSLIISLEHPPYQLVDAVDWIAKQEKGLLGIEFTQHAVDIYDTLDANCTCRQYVRGYRGKNIAIAAQVEDARKWKTKKGQMMAFLKLNDGTCILDNVTVFTDTWSKYSDDIQIGSILLFKGQRDKNYGSFNVNDVKKLNKHI